MSVQTKFLLCAVAMSGFAAFAAVSPAQALTTQECSAKYQAAKSAGTLNGQKWNDFRKAQCGADATAAPAAAPPADAKPAAAPHIAAAPPTAQARGQCGVPLGCRSEIRQGNRGQGAHAYLRRPVQCQQGQQRQWRPEVDSKGWWLLQRVQQEAEGRISRI